MVQTYINKFGVVNLVNQIWLRDVSMNGMYRLGINENEKIPVCWSENLDTTVTGYKSMCLKSDSQ